MVTFNNQAESYNDVEDDDTRDGGERRHRPSKLEDQAATAALYVTHPENAPALRTSGEGDHSLSFAGAAHSLRYAQPQDLPSFPSLGLTNGEASAGAAASLANSGQKSIDLWKPDPSASASAAAVLAKDYKSSDAWKPEKNNYGSQAALLAVDMPPPTFWSPEKSTFQDSAAAQAFRSRPKLASRADYGYTTDGQRRSLQAATDAMSNGRRRAGSSPIPSDSFSESLSPGTTALNAATIAHKPSIRATNSPSKATMGGSATTKSQLDINRILSVANENALRDMRIAEEPFRNRQSVEKDRADTLRAASISMARTIYARQQQQSASGRPGSPSAESNTSLTSGFYSASLEEAAKRQAAERLARLRDEHDAYKTYYGVSPKPRGSIRRRGRAQSFGEEPKSDQEQSRKIRSDMTLFADRLTKVDVQRRQKDRDALMAAAQRNVNAKMSGMDASIAARSGHLSPKMAEQWKSKAEDQAQEDSKVRMSNYGKIDIGGGKYMDRAEVDAIAARRVQPVLDELNEKVEIQRARVEETRLDREERKRLEQIERAREKELKADLQRAKEREKQEERARKGEQDRPLKSPILQGGEDETTEVSAAKRLERQLDKEEEKRLREVEKARTESLKASVKQAEALQKLEAKGQSSSNAPATQHEPLLESSRAVGPTPKSPVEQDNVPESDLARQDEPEISRPEAPATDSPIKKSETADDSKGGIKTWLRGKFGAGGKKQDKVASKFPNDGRQSPDAALDQSKSHDTDRSSLDNQPSSVRDVALAGRAPSSEIHKSENRGSNFIGMTSTSAASPVRGSSRRRSSTSVSISSQSDLAIDVNDTNNNRLDTGRAPGTLPIFSSMSRSPIRDSKFHEDF